MAVVRQDSGLPTVDEMAELLNELEALAHVLGPQAGRLAQVLAVNTADLRQAAHTVRLAQVRQQWELYQAYLVQGFNESQAFSMVQRAGSRGEGSLLRDVLGALRAAAGS